MGATPSHEAFTGVLPAATRQRQPQTPVVTSVSSLKAKPEEPDSLATPASSVQKELISRIQPPAHALQQPSLVATAREERLAGGAEDTGATDRFLMPESVRKSRTLDAFTDVCSEILPKFLFVSNLVVARDPQKLRELGITHIVNCCEELCQESPDPAGAYTNPVNPSQPFRSAAPIEHLRLALRDDTHEDLSWFFYQVMSFIQNAQLSQRSPPGRVLVHCHQGISRSCAFVVAYFMYQQSQRQGLTPNFRDALAMVKAQRPIASPNTAFLCQLIEWERELQTFATGNGSTPRFDGDKPLYRLAPHARHDPNTLVLKSCFVPGSQRQRVAFDAEEDSGDQRRWLFSRGLFVFVRPATGSRREIVVWKGRKCEISNGVAVARAHVVQMVRLRLGLLPATAEDGNLAPFGVDIVEVCEEDGEVHESSADGSVDHFGYAEELSWLMMNSSSTVLSPTCTSIVDADAQEIPELTNALAGTSITNEPPQLFVFESADDGDGDTGSWDRLSEYDSEDLTLSDAFLLVQRSMSHHFLWIGPLCSQLPVETLVKCAQAHVKKTLLSNGDEAMGTIEIITGGEESDAFWAVFEQGY